MQVISRPFTFVSLITKGTSTAPPAGASRQKVEKLNKLVYNPILPGHQAATMKLTLRFLYSDVHDRTTMIRAGYMRLVSHLKNQFVFLINQFVFDEDNPPRG